ncbi:hypothetical protein [Amycolatopsis sp. YIM 10]|uniref:hypothetical protein n=1 Tax=Amycolatopsis sp. YIM 10 TaxID=2653857 RepID=UPI0012904721|nr:hypothetical protein [Amycolatopsis sp. YIM 10]QFU88481.1 hypothetical protein YIM_16505 [Amycolatopsis sp. YIM 10]
MTCSAALSSLPPDWRELAIDYRVVGRNIGLSVGLLGPGDSEHRLWTPPDEPIRQFQRLRGGMYRENEGTWFSLRYVLEPGPHFSVSYNWRNEPDFQPYPSPDAFLLEQERFPREERFMPSWYRDQLAAARRWLSRGTLPRGRARSRRSPVADGRAARRPRRW